MKRIWSATLLAFMLVFVLLSTAQAQSPQQVLNQYVADLQKNPNDYALREKIIKYAQTMKPAPSIPLEAEKFEGRAEFAIKNAKTEADFLDAAKEYEKALLIAPWCPAYYFNQGIAFEKAGKLKEAKRSFEFYLLAAPNAQDARDVRKRVAGLEYAMEKAAKETPRQVSTAPKQDTFEDLLRKIDGRRYATWDRGRQVLLDVKGRTFVLGCIEDNRSYTELYRSEIRGREFTEPVYEKSSIVMARIVERNWSISENGESVTLRFRWSSGEIEQLIYRWQR